MPRSQRDTTAPTSRQRRSWAAGFPVSWHHGRGMVAGRSGLVLAVLCQLNAQLPAQVGGTQWQPLGGRAVSPAPAVRSGSVVPVVTTANQPQRVAPGGAVAADTLRQRTETLARQGRLSEALAGVRELRRGDPNSVEYRLMEAQYLGWLGRTATAGGLYARIGQEGSGNAEAAEGLGNTWLWRGDWREAQSAYANAINLTGGQNAAAQVGFQRALLAAGRASAAYRQAAELDRRGGRQDAELGLFLATIHGAVDDDETAFALSRRRTSDADVRQRQLTFQAQRLIARGRADEGLNLIASHAEALPRDYAAQVAAGEVFTVAGKSREARDYLERAARLAPTRDEAVLALARLARQQGKPRDSLALYEDVVARNPESVPAWLGIAEVAQSRGDLNHAWQALDAAQRVAPTSALVYRERLKIAFREKDATTFTGVLRAYQRAQPADAWPELWAQKWADAHGGEINVAALQSLLDPLAPDLSSEALRLLRRHTGEPMQRAVMRVPAAPSPDLHEAAQAKLGKQVRVSDATVIGVSTGYEFSTLQDTSGAGARLQEWHEGYLAAYWRRPLGMAVSGEFRTFSRFGTTANQLMLGWNTHLTPSWIVGLDGGGALSGGFIPRWRLGARTEYLFSDTFSMSLGVSHLRFADEPVFQVIPGMTWQWHPQWSSHLRMFVTHTEPKGGRVNTGFAGLISTTWQFSPLSSTTLSYAMGEENASQLVQSLIGEKNFQSVGVDLKYGFNDRFSLQPTYRYETHNLFDLHAIGLSLHLRY
ncbi:MAG: hypothetical protein B9S33_21375 [Pedosphaera sp. Tous-C6FEB]|nr:MAG: hypothetical protein B9S33_21375 [Pedosphaera sp. Tous-C6FEB]